MPNCDLCGKETELFTAKIEGTILDVCNRCAQYGQVMRNVPSLPSQKAVAKPGLPKRELLEVIHPQYGERVKQARERLGLKQEELAKKLAEKESILNKVESGKFEPSITLARKLEKVLRITLVEQHEEVHEASKATVVEGLTLGEMLKEKMQKS